MNTKYDFPLIHRDISWLSFNYRVLQEAKDPNVPLFERIKFLGIYSSNLDEFFRVRVASLKTLIRFGKKTKLKMSFDPEQILEEIRTIVTKQQLEFDEIYHRQILPELNSQDIHIIKPVHLVPAHVKFIQDFYEEELIEFIQPILLVKDKIRTFLSDKGVYLAVKLKTKGNNNRYAVVRIPTDRFSRFIKLPSSVPNRKELIFIDDIVRYCLAFMFPGYQVIDSYSIKITRDADIYIEDEFSGDLIEKIKKGIAKRTIGKGTRFSYDRTIPQKTLNFLIGALDIKQGDLIAEGRYTNNNDLFKFPNFGLSELMDEALVPLSQRNLDGVKKMFAAIDERDHLLHFPYQKYEYVIRFLEFAARDPKVTDIKIVQYRVARDSRIVAALRSAIQEGKNVMVFMEVKARFDEKANLYWAERLESWGATVIYSFPALKVHAKLLLVKRKAKHYAFLGTGNFNEDTAALYSDFGLFTSNKKLTKEVAEVFKFLEFSKLPNQPFEHLLVGQFRLRRNIYQLIDHEIAAAKMGQKASIILKLNSIQDPRMIARLYQASNAGVKIKMIVRGVCSLVPGIKGFSENIEVISIVDRFLEHTRIYKFHRGGNDKIYLSSADWMTRNLYYRIECAFPLYDQAVKDEINDFLDIQLKDNVKARIVDAEHNNHYKMGEKGKQFRSQMMLYEYYQNKLLRKRN